MNRLRRDWPRLLLGAMALAAIVVTAQAGWRATAGLGVGSRAQAAAQRLDEAVGKADNDARVDAERPPRPDHPQASASGAGQEDPGQRAAERIRNRFLFMPRPPDMFRNIQGVLGDRVLYQGGQSFGVGDNAMGATVKAIGSDWVEFEHQGQIVRIEMFQGGKRRP